MIPENVRGPFGRSPRRCIFAAFQNCAACPVSWFDDPSGN
jgi:hypothetical protein